MTDLTKCNLCYTEWPNHHPNCAYVITLRELHAEVERARDKHTATLRAINIHGC
jgi:hypothetical protein